MPLDMHQAAYSPESWAAQIKNPQDRTDIGRSVCEAAGGKLVGAWCCFGEYDVVVIADMPDNESMAALAIALSAGGAAKSAKTTVLMSVPQALAGLTKAAEVAKSYTPPR